ncbi:MAG TPA: hypothetical protein VIV40_34620 [Kofleriaceae bacterium]
MLRLYVICVALTGLACRDSAIQKLEQIRDEVCECKTATCAERALDRVPKDNVQSTPRSQRIAREMLDCLAAIYEKNRPTQDPDAETTDPETSEPASARRP